MKKVLTAVELYFGAIGKGYLFRRLASGKPVSYNEILKPQFDTHKICAHSIWINQSLVMSCAGQINDEHLLKNKLGFDAAKPFYWCLPSEENYHQLIFVSFYLGRHKKTSLQYISHCLRRGSWYTRMSSQRPSLRPPLLTISSIGWLKCRQRSFLIFPCNTEFSWTVIAPIFLIPSTLPFLYVARFPVLSKG